MWKSTAAFSFMAACIITCVGGFAVEAANQSTMEQLKQAQKLARAGSLAEARKLADSIASTTQAPEALALLADIEENMGDFEGALNTYTKLSGQQELWQARLGMARCYRSLGRYRQATEILQTLAQQHPQEAKVWLNLAVALLESGDLETAEAAARRALVLDQDSETAARILGEVKLQQAQFRYAKELGTAILNYHPTNKQNYAFLLRCMSYAKTMPEELNEMIDLACDNLPDDAQLYWLLGRQAEQHARAIKAGNSAKLLRRKNSWYLVSARALELACSKSPQTSEYHLATARVLAQLGMNHASARQAQTACQLNPQLKLSKQVDRACRAAHRDIAGRLKLAVTGAGS